MIEQVVPVVLVVVLIFLITEGLVSLCKAFGKDLSGKPVMLAAVLVGLLVAGVNLWINTLPPPVAAQAVMFLQIVSSIVAAYGLNDTVKPFMPK